MAETQQHEPDPKIPGDPRSVERPRVVDHDFLEHAQKIALIVVLAAIWIVFRVHAIAPDAKAAFPPASSPIPNVAGEPLAPSLVDEPKSGMEIGYRFLTLPVRGIRPADLFDSFDEERGNERRHEAIDIIAELNTPVLAAENGTIARLENNARGGRSIHQFDPTGRYVYYYAHLASYARGLEEGSSVSRGDVIGRVGQSGNAQTPHLHFAISRVSAGASWWSGQAINPYPILLNAQPSQGDRQADQGAR